MRKISQNSGENQLAGLGVPVSTMIKIRKAEKRGKTQLGWLDSRHTFSFGDYRDPEYMGFRALRVINDDIVTPGQGFGTHPHSDMEIVTYVLEGALEHRDSMGHGSVIPAGGVQYMSAGSGVTHSEFNPSKTDPVHLLQIWIFPNARGLEPKYEERPFPDGTDVPGWHVLLSGDGERGSIIVRQDIRLYTAAMQPDEELVHPFAADRYVWVHLATGELTMNGQTLRAGDGSAVHEEEMLTFKAIVPSKVLLFDLA
jgi:redox-sensitive bicupin YhaK (pirin superfamily)